MNPWWYMHSASLKLLLPSMNIPHVWHDFSFDKGKMRYTYRNFGMIFPLMNTWWYMHAVTFKQYYHRTKQDDIYIPPIWMKWLSLLMSTCTMICTPQLLNAFPHWWTHGDIYIPNFKITFTIDKHVMIYTYCNFKTTFFIDKHTIICPYRNFWITSLLMNTRWYILFNFQTTFPLMNMLRYVNTAAFNCLFPLMNPWWYMHFASLKLLLRIDEHSATFKCLSHWQTRNEICIPQFWNDFPFDEYMMIYTYRNFQMTFLLINTWYIHTATLKWLRHWLIYDDIEITQLWNDFLIVEHLMI